MKLLVTRLLLMVSFASSTVALAEEVDFYSLVGSVEEAQELRRDNGVIQKIDLSERTIRVSGFDYFLVPSTESQPLTVKLLGRNFGALEMLKIGMHVQIDFIKAGEYRVGFDIVQIEQSDPS